MGPRIFGLVVGAGFGLALAGTAPGAPLAYEGFEYATATLAGQNGGSGFAGSWKSDLALTADSSSEVQAGSLAAPSGYVAAPAGGSAKLAAQTAIFRALAGGAQLSLDTDDDYYLSFISERSGGIQRFRLYDGSTLALNFQTTSAGNVSIQQMGVNTNSTGNEVVAGAPVLWVIKIAAASGAGLDQVFVQVYPSTSAVPAQEPAAWLLSSNQVAKTGTISVVEFQSAQAGVIVQVDELRIGQSWADVAGVPEPAAALPALALAGLLARRRRAS